MARYPLTGEQSFIVCLCKGKGDALERGNYCGLKLTEQVMKILERIVDSLIRQLVSIDNSQFGTTGTIFVVRQLQEKYLAANKRLYMAFVDLEKAFDRVPQKVIWWALRKLGVEEWIVRLVQRMYANAQSRVRVGEGYSEEFEVKVGVHQGSVLSPLLFIIHGAWSLITRVPLWGPMRGPLCWWPCYHHWIASGICQEALDLERSNGEERTESKCRKDKDHDLQYGTGPPAEFRRVSMRRLSHWSGSNSIFCNGCKHWVHKKCSGLKCLKNDPDYRCTRCQGTARPLDGRPQKEVQVGPDKLEVVASFCYLGDMLSAAGGCELSTTTCVKIAWKKFKDLLPVLSSRHLSFKIRGRVYSSCVRSAMLHVS